ncbi:hypothetical protein I4U23_010917 [Adineta vaga]|nr:hypothetical protein I4U23_010917 [Adineta vaga]
MEESSTLTWKTKILNTLKTLNLFESEESDIETVRYQRWSTRLYIVLFSSFMMILIIYVCSSKYITQEYINSVYNANVSFISFIDIRTTISSFCNISKNTWKDAYNNFNTTLLISSVVESPLLIETRVNNLLNFSLAFAVNTFEDRCSCSNTDGCLRSIVMFRSNKISDVPDIMFNCLSLLQQYLSINEKLQPLNASTHFI